MVEQQPWWPDYRVQACSQLLTWKAARERSWCAFATARMASTSAPAQKHALSAPSARHGPSLQCQPSCKVDLRLVPHRVMVHNEHRGKSQAWRRGEQGCEVSASGLRGTACCACSTRM